MKVEAKHSILISKGKELMKNRSLYECAEYCYKYDLDIETFKKTKYPTNPSNFIFSNKSWYEYFNKKK